MNAIMTIRPYRFNGTWVFDDPAVGLVREPFVAGIPEMIDRLVGGVPGAERGFRLLFSGGPFPGTQVCLAWVREEIDGNWYRWHEGGLEGWICPALFKYFDRAPERLYLRLEPEEERSASLVVSRVEVERLREALRRGDLSAARAMVEAVLA